MSGNAQVNRTGGGEADAPEVASGVLDVYECEINGVQISLKPGKDGTCVLSADLGPLAEDDAAALIGEMLAANYAFQGAAGATLSVEPGTGHVFLRRRVWPDDSNEDAILPEVVVFADKAREWRERIAGENFQKPCNLLYEIV